MNFSIPENATSDEIEAIIERGMDAMMDAVENGGDRRSLFPDGTGDQKSNTRTRVTVVQEENSHDDMVDEKLKKRRKKRRSGVSSAASSCVFFSERRTTREYDDAEYGDY
jgi:hypothetical protein